MNYSVIEVKDDNTEDSTRNITWIEDGLCFSFKFKLNNKM